MKVVTHFGEASWLDKVKSGGSQASGYDYSTPATPAKKKKQEKSWLDKAKESVDNLLSKTVKRTPVPKTESQKSYGSESGSIAPYQSFAPVEEGMSMKIKIMIGGVALLVIGGIAFAINKKRG